MEDKGEIVIYQTQDGITQLDVRLDGETVWLSQDQMAQLFERDKSVITRHISNIYSEGELPRESTSAKIAFVPQTRERTYEVTYYNLDVIISVGYRVKSQRGVQFRQWATKRIHEYIVKGFTLDDERLKGKNIFGADYFDDLLDRIREIRLSERRYYQKITDIYSECSADYDKDSETTKLFFKTVQNMMHYAVTKQTAAEIIYDRADAERPHMGLTTWKNAPDGRVIKSDVTIAKNYLSEKEVESLNLLSNAFIDMAELRARDHILMTMADWKDVLSRYMELNNKALLPDAGRITHEQAEEKALTEYEKFRVIQDREIMSDFDRQLKSLFDGNESGL